MIFTIKLLYHIISNFLKQFLYYLKHQYDLDQFININHNYKKSK